MAKRLGTGLLKAQMQEIQSTIAMNGSRLTNVKGVEMNVYSEPASADESGGFGDSTGLVVPANSILTGLGCVVTTELAASTGTPNWQCNFGLTEGAHDLTTNNVDSLQAGGGTVAVGVGTSTHSHETTAMGGGAALVFEGSIGTVLQPERSMAV